MELKRNKKCINEYRNQTEEKIEKSSYITPQLIELGQINRKTMGGPGSSGDFSTLAGGPLTPPPTP